ncbi:SDR family oxidoreductase [Streptomyces polychromogenes]|uniref:SDR family oxidoreductase n=1 Tax=Streptomyces polychromogenes TaxID=67342 RepID=A0ABN0V1Q9_9ACTN
MVITGASGFLGQCLTRTLLAQRTFAGTPLSRLVLADTLTPPDGALAADPLVDVVHGDLNDRLADLFRHPVDVVFHLAAAVSAACEADFDLGMRTNIDTTRALLDTARTQVAAGGPLVRLVFSSSLAVYSTRPDHPTTQAVSENTAPVPHSSYGMQKLVCEHLIADYTRRGYLDGRTARLMTVAVRPGTPNAAASGFLSSLIREPLAGRLATCPVPPELPVALASPRTTIQGLLRLAEAERGHGPGRLDGPEPVNLPALTVTVTDIITALQHLAGDTTTDLITHRPDPTVQAIVTSWPAVFDNQRATALGLTPDPDIHSLLSQYLTDHPHAVRAPTARRPPRRQTPPH